MESEMMMSTAEMPAGGGVFLMVFFLVWLVAYVFYAYCLMLLAKKTNTENGWMAFVPILNIYLMLQIGRRPAWELIMFFIPLLSLVWAIMAMNSISQRCGKGIGMTLALIFLAPFSLPYLAFTYPQETAGQNPGQPAPVQM